MNILVVSQYFYPEEFKINDLVEELITRGHDITVLTGKPNYPRGEYFQGYKFWGVQNEDYKGARVIRVPLIKRKGGGAVRLVLNYFSFAFFACLYVLFHKMPFDSIICFQTSPVTQAYPAIWAKRKCKAKLSMWVQDLWPESVSAASNIKNPKIIKLIGKMVKHIYDKCDVLMVQSKKFSESIMEKGAYSDKLVYVPNWAEDVFANSPSDFEKYKSIMPDGFIVMFAGNIGEAQDFNSIIQAAKLTRDDKSIKWVIVGDGRYRKNVEDQVISNDLCDTVILLGRYPVDEMPNFFIHAGVMLVTLKDEYIFSLTIPSKTQAYMSFGKPIATMINGVGNEIINEARCGLCANAGDYNQLARNVISLSRLSDDELKRMGRNAKEYYREEFAKSKVIDIIENYL